MKYIPLVVGVLVVQLVIAYVVANWWLSPATPEGEMATEEQVAEPPPDAQEGMEFQMAPGTSQVAALYEKLEPIVVNPAGTEGLRFLSAQVHLGLSSPSVLEIIDKHNMVPRIKDRLIDIFRTKRIEDLEP
jgi:flagellar basal body-associated protein FliL